MYERFTDRARKVMQLANQQAQKFNHEWIAPEHILLGLAKEGSGVAAHVLKNLGVECSRIEEAVSTKMTCGPDMVTMGKLPQTPRAKKVLQYAFEESRNLTHNYVGTEHILLGLLREEEGIPVVVLETLGLTADAVRKGIVELLGSSAERRPSVLSQKLPEALAPSVLQQILAELRRTNELLAAMAKQEVKPHAGGS